VSANLGRIGWAKGMRAYTSQSSSKKRRGERKKDLRKRNVERSISLH
jgi:hypothetical protein